MNITTNEELRAAVTLLTAHVNNMCNTKDGNDVVKSMSEAKDLLINIYKYNAGRVAK